MTHESLYYYYIIVLYSVCIVHAFCLYIMRLRLIGSGHVYLYLQCRLINLTFRRLKINFFAPSSVVP